MRKMRFFYPGPYPDDTEIDLPDELFRHAIQVLRLKNGAQFQLFDGEGHEYLVQLTEVGKRQARMQLIEPVHINVESPLDITLMQGISRGERMDFAIQKAVELGVKTIIPVVTERCNVQLGGDRAYKRMQHWQGVIISACEQSGRNYRPTLHSVTPLEVALEKCVDPCRLVLSPDAQQGFTQMEPQHQITLLIGPEGGLSEEEIQQAVAQHFTPLRFGPRILRTETASAAALAIVQAQWGDIG